MSWLQDVDVALFRFINHTLSNPVCDRLMPFLSGNPLFVPVVALAVIALLWRGGARGRLFVVTLLVVILLGEELVSGVLKKVIGRPRPFVTLPDVHLLAGQGSHASMPSGHAANWFAAAMVTLAFYRRSWRFMVPLAAAVGLSRIFVGVHYPSDVLAGAIIGAGCAAAALCVLQAGWQRVGRTWFPLWWAQVPSLVPFRARQPGEEADSTPSPSRSAGPSLDQHWLRLGYVLLAMALVARLAYLGSDLIDLSKDEAYQWTWSKHLALSYYSKPPLIAYLQWLGTTLWGDTEFGVRFCSPVLAAVLGSALLRFFARHVSAQAGFWVLLLLSTAPMLAVGTILMTIDPPLVLFWTLAMLTGWRAVQRDGRTSHWAWVGLWLGLAFLSKYTALYQLICWALFFVLWPPARAHLRRPGPYLALSIVALSTLPVVIWNMQHDWVTVDHVAWNAGRSSPWKPSLRFTSEFLVSQALLLNPICFVALLWAGVAFWRRAPQEPLLRFFFCMGAPVFLGHLMFTVYKRVFPNWVAPALVPLFCLMVIYWHERWRQGLRTVPGALKAALLFGLVCLVPMHESRLLGKVLGRELPPNIDPLRRVRAWEETAKVVEQARRQLQAEGKPVFVICDHYGLTGQFSFYLPGAQAAVRTRPLVYAETTDQPDNQFYFWPGYPQQRRGDNALYVIEADLPRLKAGWWTHWLAGQTDLYDSPRPSPAEPPQRLAQEFESVTEWGEFDVRYRGRVFRRVQLFVCRNLR